MQEEIYKNLSLEDLPGEVWKPITNWDSYFVSNLGRIKSVPYDKFRKMERILKQHITGNGYLTVKLYHSHNKRNIRVHKLVADAFLAHIDGLNEINHKDENKLNNKAENLQRCDRKFNVNYGERNLLASYKLRNRKDQSKIVLQIDQNGNILRQFRSVADAGRFYKCYPSYIQRVCAGERSQYKGMFFKYK